ncbi:MAG: hypothetical protein ACTS42_01550 [Candidatus Hodgkinia cicadicola]
MLRSRSFKRGENPFGNEGGSNEISSQSFRSEAFRWRHPFRKTVNFGRQWRP